MKNIDIIKKTVSDLSGHVLFEYNNRPCGIDPIKRDARYDMWYGDKNYTAKSLKEVLEANIFSGKNIMDIAEHINDLEV